MEPVSALSMDRRPAAPRRVELRAGRDGIKKGLWALFLPHFWVGIGLAFGAIGQLAFPLVARTVDGELVEGRTVRGKNGPRHELVVTVSAAGMVGEHVLPASEAEVQAAVKGAPLSVRAANILGMEMVRRADRVAFPVLVPAAIFWNGVVAVFMWQFLGRSLTAWWLLRRGARAKGRIVGRDAGPKGGTRVRYAFGLAGAEASSMAAAVESVVVLSEKDAVRAEGLTDVTVYHHPRWPRLAAVEELSPYRVVQ